MNVIRNMSINVTYTINENKEHVYTTSNFTVQ